MRNRKLAYILPGHEGEVFSLAWSPDSRHLASAGTDKVVRIWDLPGGRLGRVLSEYPHPIKQVAWSSDGEWLAAASIEGGGAHWWSMKDDRRRVEALGSPVHSIAWSRDVKRLAAATDDRKVRIWQLDSEQPPLLLNADQSPVIHLAWSPDDRWLAAAEGLSIGPSLGVPTESR
jgi:WD40 repeat protein